jgi:DNA-binding response OmpR family regulator
MIPAVLIIDDSVTVRMDLQEIFESAGFAPMVCDNLRTAREALAQHTFALVILDVLLPDGDGIELLQEIKMNPATQAIPVLLLSTEVEVRDRIRGLKTGADDYVGKPYESNYLLVRARELMGISGAKRSKPMLLLIDGCAEFSKTFTGQLEGAGYHVVRSPTADEGLHSALALRPDVIAIDGTLPGGIGGAAVIRRLKQDISVRGIPCLLLTASEGSAAELEALESGADAFLRKDTDRGVLLARIAALRRSRAVEPAVGSATATLFGPKKILTVDDSPTFLHEISSELHQEGYDVVPAHSGKEALELLEAQPVDCILLDLRMPGMSGEETCRLIKQNPDLKHIPLVLLTAVEEPAVMVEGINAGADDYVSKSTDFDVLKARVRAQLRRKQFEDEYRRIREQLLQKEIEATQARAARDVSEARARLVDELEQKNRDLEAFTYSVAHDLRAPLRAISGFSQSVLQSCGELLPAIARDDLARVHAAVVRMRHLIDALLELSHSGLTELHRQPTDLSKLARAVGEELARGEPERQVNLSVEEDLTGNTDPALARVILANLLGNAWKFTGKVETPRIQVGAMARGDQTVFFVKDNGAGFDSARARDLFRPFHRLHAARDFPGAGIGLATARRIIERHGGEIWAESAAGCGASFYFTLTRHDAEPCPAINEGRLQ